MQASLKVALLPFPLVKRVSPSRRAAVNLPFDAVSRCMRFSRSVEWFTGWRLFSALYSLQKEGDVLARSLSYNSLTYHLGTAQEE